MDWLSFFLGAFTPFAFFIILLIFSGLVEFYKEKQEIKWMKDIKKENYRGPYQIQGIEHQNLCWLKRNENDDNLPISIFFKKTGKYTFQEIDSSTDEVQSLLKKNLI